MSTSGRSLQALVVDELGQRMANADLRAGDVLVPESLADEFGVSRTVVRESFRVLEALGMITARPRTGTVVRAASDWRLLDPRVIGWRARGPEAATQLHELLVLREAVEPTIARLAATHASLGELDDIRTHQERMVEAFGVGDVSAFARADAALHSAIVRACRNTAMQQLLATIEAALASRYSDHREVFTDATETALARHRELVDALVSHEGDRASDIMARLIREARAETMRFGGEEPTPSARH